MKYQISLASIEKIANPFKQMSLDYLHSPLSMEEVEDRIKKGYVKDIKKPTPRDILIKDIVSKIANYNINEEIIMNLEQPINNETGWLVENVSQLAALIYLHRDNIDNINIQANIIGDRAIIEKLFHATFLGDIIDMEPSQKMNNMFDWFVYDEHALSPWAHKETVLLENDSEKIVKLADQSLWDDKDFIIQLLAKFDYYSKNIIQNILPDNIAYNDTMLELANEDPIIFCKLWPRIVNDKNLSIEKKTLMKNQLALNFQDINKLVPILTISDKANLQEILLEIPIELRVTEEITQLIYKQNVRRDNYVNFTDILYNYFPDSYFKEQTNINNFILYVIENSIYDTNPSHIFNYWVQDKEHVLSFFDKNPIGLIGSNNLKGLNYFYKCLSSDLKVDKEIIVSFINAKYTYISSQLDKNLLADKDIIIALINQIDSTTVNHTMNTIERKNLLSIEDQDYQSKLLKNSPQLINDKHMPSSWLENPQNIVLCANYIHDVSWDRLPTKVKTEVTTNKHLAMQLVNNVELYEKLPLSLKLDSDVVMKISKSIFVQRSIEDANKKINKMVPQSIWLNRDFCVQALFDKKLLPMEKIPEHFFNEKDFIIKLLSMEKILKADQFKEAIDILPERLNIFFKENNVTKNYLEFMEKIFFKEKLEFTLPNKIENKPKKKI